MNVEVRPVGETDQQVLSNLLQLYLHDFSEFDDGRISEDGLFQYPYLEQYRSEPDHHAFLILVDASLAGFALVKKGSDMAGDMQAMDIAEFFILRGWRRKGVGKNAFHAIAGRFPGSWLVRVQTRVLNALSFWRSVIPDVSDGKIGEEQIDDGGKAWTVFRFVAPAANSDR